MIVCREPETAVLLVFEVLQHEIGEMLCEFQVLGIPARLQQFEQRVEQEGVVVEVGPHRLLERVLADPGLRHAQQRGALAVGDAVKIGEGLGGVFDRQLDGMGGDQFIGGIGRSLCAQIEVLPDVVELAVPGQCQVAHIRGEALLQPQAVPPPHGHKVAEPHVRHFVGNHRGEALALGLAAGAALGLGMAQQSAQAADLKIGMITTLSGGGSSLGIDVRDG